jgi:hypothetical protein
MTSLLWGFLIRKIPTSICICFKVDDTPKPEGQENAPLLSSIRRKPIQSFKGEAKGGKKE